jgi:hypothetical protein
MRQQLFLSLGGGDRSVDARERLATGFPILLIEWLCKE